MTAKHIGPPGLRDGYPTLEFEIRRLFPHGTQGGSRPIYSKPPSFPSDLFAAAAYLLESSGAYTFIVAPFKPTSGAADVSYRGPTMPATPAAIKKYRKLGRLWAREPAKAERPIESMWLRLWNRRKERFVASADDERPLGWWAIAYALLIIADEASVDCGYSAFNRPHVDADSDEGWANDVASFALHSSTRREVIPNPRSKTDKRHLSRHVALDSIGSVARHVARVLPKGRTTELGCTLRTLSHNLTLLPPHGFMNTYWHQQLWREGAADGDKLSILLVPFPYHIANGSFIGDTDSKDVETPAASRHKWGRFRIDQTWLRPDSSASKSWSTESSRSKFVKFLDALLAKSIDNNLGGVQGIFLPEYSLDWETYDHAVRHIRDNWPMVEFMIAGVSKDCSGRLGNHVVFTIFNSGRNLSERFAETHSRRKHHRWRLDATQVKNYDLQNDLDPAFVWWEYLEIEDRVMHIDVFRNQSAFTAVICEDLARADPGVSQLRAVGPNLVFALLMDGPQRRDRWPGQYAGSLSDDPGSSILTLTSFGLIDRSNTVRMQREEDISRIIALWRNRPDTSAFSSRGTDCVEIELDEGALGVVVNLQSARAMDITMDGRQDTDTTSWYYRDHLQLKFTDKTIDDNDWKWIVGPSFAGLP